MASLKEKAGSLLSTTTVSLHAGGATNILYLFGNLY
jgi:hypothetical protein